MSSFLRTVLNSDGMEDWIEDKMELNPVIKRIITEQQLDSVAYRIGGQN